MDFAFSHAQQMIRKEVRRFAREELAPRYSQWDREKRYPRELLRKMGELGLIGLFVRRENGGAGESCVTGGIVCEELSRGDCNLPMSTQAAGHLCAGLLEQGSREVQQAFLEPLLAGRLVCAFCLTEPGNGTDAAALQTSAEKRGPAYVLNGEKSGIAAMMDADLATVFARSEPGTGARGGELLGGALQSARCLHPGLRGYGLQCSGAGLAFYAGCGDTGKLSDRRGGPGLQAGHAGV